MTAAWGRNWVKLYRQPSQEFEGLTLSARGLASVLLRAVDDAGRLFLRGLDPHVGVARILGAHPSERRRVKDDLEALLADGFCAVADGYLVVRNFVVAQKSVSPSAERMRTHREKAARQADDSDATGREQGESTKRADERHEIGVTAQKDSSASVTVASPKEQIRTETEQTPDPPKPPVGGPGASDAPKDEPAKPKRRRAEPRPDEVPPAGTLARRVYDAITADPLLGPATTRPGGFATRIADPKTYPGVDVLAEVQRCGVWAETATRQILSGNGTLSTWLKRAADECARRGVAAVGAGAGPRPGLRKGPADTNASAAEWDRIAAGEAPEDFWSGQRAARGGVA